MKGPTNDIVRFHQEFRSYVRQIRLGDFQSLMTNQSPSRVLSYVNLNSGESGKVMMLSGLLNVIILLTSLPASGNNTNHTMD